MNLLLDTHAWLWFHLGEPQLSQTARQHISNPANTSFVSAASLWEISIKISLGKYVLHTPYARFIHDSIAGQGFGILPVTPAHSEVVAGLPFQVIGGKEHRDPFDRLLISQAKTEGMGIVTADASFSAYSVLVIW